MTERCTEYLSAFYELLGNGMTVGQAYNLAKTVSVSRAFELKRRARNSARCIFVDELVLNKDVLVLASSPSNKDEIILQGLAFEIDAIKRSLGSDSVQVKYPVSRREVVMSIAYYKPRILHITSHANETMIAFYDYNGNLYELEKYWIINVVKEFKNVIECIVLNSCINAPIAYRLSEHIPYVIGTQTCVDIRPATEFSGYFYQNLGQNTYQKAFIISSYMLHVKYRFIKEKEFCLFRKCDYKPSYYDINDDKKMRAKELFLDRYGSCDEKWIHAFREEFDGWYDQFSGNPVMQRLALQFLDMFRYYSKKSVDEIARVLFFECIEKIKSESKLEDSVIAPLPSQKPRINSSYLYWGALYQMNELSKFYYQPDITKLGDQLKHVKNIVFFDDMLGSGKTFCDYLEKEVNSLTGKNIYYLVVHGMEEGIGRINKTAKNLSLSVNVIAYRRAKKAFTEYRVKKNIKKRFEQFCLENGISEDYVLGYGNSEAVCGFYNSIPNNNFGIIADEFTEDQIEDFPMGRIRPLFMKIKADKPSYAVKKKDIQPEILKYLQKHGETADLHTLAEKLDLTDIRLEELLAEMLKEKVLQNVEGELCPAQNRKIVIFGGSFNPPTAAHEAVLRSAIEQLDADYGMFVPSSDAYVVKKMTRAGEVIPPLSEKLRTSMLQALCDENEKFLVGKYELGDDGKGHSYDTMCQIQKMNPNAELYFLMGEDKLEIFKRWHSRDEFLKKFHIAVVNRDGQDPMAFISEDPFLSQYKDRFVSVTLEETDIEISSGNVRKAFLQGTDLSAFMNEKIINIWQNNSEVITKFRGEYHFLSNFYEAKVTYNGKTYLSAEAAFQAQKCKTDAERDQFCLLSPKESKKLGNMIELREDWEEIRLSIMYDIVSAKFHQNEDLQVLLKKTKPMYLIEGNDWGDTFWGVDINTNEGKNYLGLILMLVRDHWGR